MSDMLLSLVQSTDSITQNFIFSGYAALVSAYKPAILALATLSIVTFGYAITNGWVKLSESEIIKRVLIAAFVLAFALHWDFFSEYVYNFFTNAPNDIATHIVQSVPGSHVSDQTSVFTELQQAFYSGIGIGQAVWERGGIGEPLAYLYAVGIWIGTLVFSGLALIEIIGAKFGLAIYMVLAPIIIPMFLFQATKSAVFDGWLRHIITFSLIPIFVMSAVTLCLMLMQSTLGNLQTSVSQDNITITNTIPYFLYSIVGIGLLIKSSVMAASTAGGIATSMASGLTSVASSARRKFMPLGSEKRKPNNTHVNVNGDGNTMHFNTDKSPTPNVEKSFQSAGKQ